LNKSEIARTQQYLRSKFGNQRLRVVARKSKDDSAEVYLGDEFIGVLFKDEDEGETSYDFQMAILDIDLPAAAE